jgi:HK97 family phage prohead protease
MELKRLNLTTTIKAVNDQPAAGEADWDIEVVCSTAALDSDDEIIEQAGWKLDRFRANPVLLTSHQHRLADGRSPVIGSFRSIGVPEGGSLTGKIRFADTDLGREFKNLYRDGHMRAISVGFASLAGEHRKVDDRQVYVHTSMELYEVSAVAVGANPEALSRLQAAGLFSEGDPALGRLAEQIARLVASRLACEKPYPNEHSCRLADPGQFAECRRQNAAREHEGKEYDVIFCRASGSQDWAEQAYRYPEAVWSEEAARAHCQVHEGEFEPAREQGQGLNLAAALQELEGRLKTFILENMDELKSLLPDEINPVGSFSEVEAPPEGDHPGEVAAGDVGRLSSAIEELIAQLKGPKPPA